MREVRPELPVIVRTFDDTDVGRLREAGAAEIVAEVVEGSLMLATQTMMQLGIPLERVMQQVSILGQIDLRVTQSLVQQLFSIDQSSAMNIANEELLVQPGICGPEFACGQFENISIFQTGDVCLAGDNRRHLITQPVRGIPIIVIPVCDELALGVLTREIALGSY